jgi:hypothetical protein
MEDIYQLTEKLSIKDDIDVVESSEDEDDDENSEIRGRDLPFDPRH